MMGTAIRIGNGAPTARRGRRLPRSGRLSGNSLATKSMMTPVPVVKKSRVFDPKTFLATIGEGRKILTYAKNATIYTQGDPADAVFYVQTGRVRLSVVSKAGKEATIAMLNEGSFFGEGALAGQLLRMGSVAAMTDCELL